MHMGRCSIWYLKAVVFHSASVIKNCRDETIKPELLEEIKGRLSKKKKNLFSICNRREHSLV